MTKPAELTTERLLLRPFSLSDIDDVLEYASDPEWAAFRLRPYDRGAAERMVARALLTSWDKEAEFAVVLDGRVIGRFSLTVDHKHQTAELGYEIARDVWGNGLAPEASAAVCDLGVPGIWAREDRRLGRFAKQALRKGDGKAGHDVRGKAPELRYRAGRAIG